MSRVLDRNGVQLTRGMRVVQLARGMRIVQRHQGDRRFGVVVATVGGEGVLVQWDGQPDDEHVTARTLTTVSAVSERRHRP